MGWFDSLASFAGNLGITVVAAAAATYALVRFVGSKWLEGRFARELENHKADIARTLDRAYKLHATELEVLPKLWRLFAEAQGDAADALAVVRFNGDAGTLSDPELTAEMKIREFADHEIDFVLQGDRFERPTRFDDICDRYRMKRAVIATNALRNYAVESSIFIDALLRDLLFEWCGLASKALSERQWLKLGIFADGKSGSNLRNAANDARAAWVERRDNIAEEVRTIIWMRLWRDIPRDPVPEVKA